MTIGPIRAPRQGPTRRRTVLRAVAALVVAAALFGAGVALGLALDDRPVPGGTRTFVRTLEPLPQQTP